LFAQEAPIRIALIAPPFIAVPPARYGGTELFIAHLAEGLRDRGHDAVVYANGESEIGVEVRWLYPHSHWPIKGEFSESLKEMIHTSWALRDAVQDCDVIHTNNIWGLPNSEFFDLPFVHTIHHEQEDSLSDFYAHFPDVHYVTISDFQRKRETMPLMRTIHHGIDLDRYICCPTKGGYLSFLGRIAPIKGAHLAIAVAQKSGLPLKIAGEIQPMFQDYFDTEIKPHIDGKFIEYIGEAGLEEKNELLAHSVAMLFPIQWNEPFGLVMIEAMACGTPVLALPGGSVEEVVQDGVSGYVCCSVEEMVSRVKEIGSHLAPRRVREYVEQNFSVARMSRDYERLYLEVASPRAREDAPSLLAAGEEDPAAAA
jgi:glycosyltransferase involved in cell wall biosynthesis